MTTPPSTGRRERHDTKTLVRLGTDARESGPVLTPPETSGSEALEGGRTPNVHLWFQGVRTPVRACAEFTETALLLDAPLPFLELESVVGCVSVDGSTLVHGRIRSVELDAAGDRSIPRLRVAVDLDDELGSLDADELYQMLPEAPVVAMIEDAPSHAPPLDRPSSAPASSPRPRVLPLLAMLVVGVAIGAGSTYGWARALSRLRPIEAAAASVPPSAVRATRAVAAGPEIEPPSIVVALSTALADELARTPAAQWLSQPEPLARFSAATPWTLEQDDEGALDEAEPTPPPEVALDTEAAAANGRGDRGFLQVNAVDTQTRVFVPMSGTADGMRQYELTTPGIAITLPQAVALAPLENYAVARGLVRRVWLRRDGGGVQVRVITKRAASRVSTSFDSDGLTVVLDM